MGIPILGDIIDNVFGSVTDIVSEAIVDKDKKMEIQLELERIKDLANERVHQEMLAQSATNTEEAKHRSIFVAGWRPFIGWVSGAGVAWTFILGPVAEWVSRLAGWQGMMPVIDASQLMTLVLAMLGVAGLRSYDKKNGTSDDTLPMFRDKKKGEPENILPPLYSAELPEDAPWSK
jgi:hypothetical protein